MSGAVLEFALKAAVLIAAGYYIGLSLIGVNLGAKFWKDAEKEEINVPIQITVATSIFRVAILIFSALFVAGYVWFATWWLGLSSWSFAP